MLWGLGRGYITRAAFAGRGVVPGSTGRRIDSLSAVPKTPREIEFQKPPILRVEVRAVFGTGIGNRFRLSVPVAVY
jgi:hypothetical protein